MLNFFQFDYSLLVAFILYLSDEYALGHLFKRIFDFEVWHQYDSGAKHLHSFIFKVLKGVSLSSFSHTQSITVCLIYNAQTQSINYQQKLQLHSAKQMKEILAVDCQQRNILEAIASSSFLFGSCVPYFDQRRLNLWQLTHFDKLADIQLPHCFHVFFILDFLLEIVPAWR